MTGGETSNNRYGGYRAYEPEYNPRIHGPYYPNKYYGKAPRASIWDLKIGHLGSHFWQSDKSFANMRQIVSKAFMRTAYNKFGPQRHGLRGFMQMVFVGSSILFVLKFGEYAAERRVKYHW